MKTILLLIDNLIKSAARAGASGSGYVIDIMHGCNVEQLQDDKAKLINAIKAEIDASNLNQSATTTATN